MLEQLVLIHQPSSSKTAPDAAVESFVQWKTCLRSIAISFSLTQSQIASGPASGERYHGIDAYKFLMEIVCGLHSPIVGETEVMGQFKHLLETSTKSLNSPQLKVFNQLLTDAKIVRQKFFLGGGSRSYGSCLRKYLRSTSSVSLLGSGQLVKEILPWLKNSPKLNIICRDVKKVRELFKDFSSNSIQTLQNSILGETLVVAAKISTADLEEIVKSHIQIKTVIDLRDISSRDPVQCDVTLVTLKQLFSEIESCEKEMQSKVMQAKVMINELSQKFFHAAELRPFGWEDLCG